MKFDQQLHDCAKTIYQSLTETKSPKKIVLAESCTGGRAAAALVSVPGISDYFCGSSVVYRPDSKTQWLGVSPALIEQFSPESAEVTAALAIQVLRRTPEASIGAAITGHLTPQPFDDEPGVTVFIAVATQSNRVQTICLETTGELTASVRTERQAEAACELCQAILPVIRTLG